MDLRWAVVLAIAGAGSSVPQAAVVVGAEAPAYVIAGGKGMARLLVGASHTDQAALQHLVLMPGSEVQPHVHDTSSELLYIEAGTVEMTLAGKPYRASAGDAIFIPAGVAHSAKVVGRFEPLRAVQLYVGPGPEQRFTQGEKLR